VNKPIYLDFLILTNTGYRIARCFTDLPGSTSRLIDQQSQIVWKIQRTVPQPGLPYTGGTAIVQEFLPSSPSKKVRTSFKTSHKETKPSCRRYGGLLVQQGIKSFVPSFLYPIPGQHRVKLVFFNFKSSSSADCLKLRISFISDKIHGKVCAVLFSIFPWRRGYW